MHLMLNLKRNMENYRKKQSDVFEATQWFKHGDHPEVTQAQTDKTLGWLNKPGQIVFPGDYIIKYDNGEYFVIPEGKFELEFEEHVKDRSNKSLSNG